MSHLYFVTFSAEAVMTVTIEADSEEEAEERVAAMDPDANWGRLSVNDVPGEIDVMAVDG